MSGPNPTTRPYRPAPHPMQHRLAQFREIPSQWCGVTYYSMAELHRKIRERNHYND